MTRPDDPPAWSIRCPWCEKPPGTRCTSRRGRRLPPECNDTHDARIDAHNAQKDVSR